MMRKIMMVLVFVLFCIPSLAFADDTAEQEAELYHTPAEKAESGEWTMISERVGFSGLVEIELGFEDTDGVNTSDITLATAQAGFKGFVSDEVTALVIIDFDDDEDNFTVDEATVDYDGEPIFFRIGEQSVPFGYYPSHFITGPLTEDLGDTEATAIVAGFVSGGLTISAWTAGGDADVANEEEEIDDYGLGLMMAPVDAIEFGASYINDLADSDAELVGTEYTERVAGVSAYLVVDIFSFQFSLEYLAATEEFDNADLDEDSDGTGDKPSAYNVEVAFEMQDNLELAVRAGGSEEFADEPESQYGICLSYGLLEGVSVSMEYVHDEFDNDFSDDMERDSVITQLAVEF